MAIVNKLKKGGSAVFGPRVWLYLLYVLAIILLIYAPSLKNNFVNWDDDLHLLANSSLRGLDGGHLKEMFTATVNSIYIPLTTLSFAVEYSFYNYRPFIYHLDNLLLHLGVVVLVFAFARRLGLSVAGAALAALLFGIHPAKVESVSWVTERKDVLYAFFYMAALCAYWDYLMSGRKVNFILTVFLGILSMLAKPMAASLPLILFLLDWFHGRKLTRAVVIEKFWLLVFIIPIGWISWSAHATPVPVAANLLESGLFWAWTFTFYLRQFLFPFLLVPIYKIPSPIAFSNPEYLLSMIVLILTAVALVRLRKQRWFAFAVMFYFLSIFFMLRFTAVDAALGVNTVADRYMYLPGLGLCLLFGLLGERLAEWAEGKSSIIKLSAIAGFLLVFIVFAWKTSCQTGVWKNSIALWQHQLAYNPDEPIALNNLATAYRNEPEYMQAEEKYRGLLRLRRNGLNADAFGAGAELAAGRVEQTADMYKKAIRIDPRYVDAYYNLANLYKDVERSHEAIELYGRVVTLRKNYKGVYYNLGRLYQKMNEPQNAVIAFARAITADPDDESVYTDIIKSFNEAVRDNPANAVYEEARSGVFAAYLEFAKRHAQGASFYFTLGGLYADSGYYVEAARAYRQALSIEPRHAQALLNLANIYEQQGQPQEAISYYKKAIEIDPRLENGYLNLGVVYAGLGQYTEAVGYYQKAIKLNQDNATAYFNLGSAYQSMGEFKPAVEAFEKVVALDPGQAQAYYSLGNLYAGLGDFKKAIPAFERTVEIDSSNGDAFFSLSLLASKAGDFSAAIRYCDEARVAGFDVPGDYLAELEQYRKAD